MLQHVLLAVAQVHCKTDLTAYSVILLDFEPRYLRLPPAKIEIKS